MVTGSRAPGSLAHLALSKAAVNGSHRTALELRPQAIVRVVIFWAVGEDEAGEILALHAPDSGCRERFRSMQGQMLFRGNETPRSTARPDALAAPSRGHRSTGSCRFADAASGAKTSLG